MGNFGSGPTVQTDKITAKSGAEFLIEKLKKEKAELLDALKDAKSEIEWAAGCTFDSPIASKLKAAANKMVIAIENAEKK